jgi:hypothetical protein
MPNTFDSIPSAILQRALANNFSVEEKGRREAMLLNKDFYYGKQEESLVFHNEDVDPYIINLTKPIVQKRATLLYKKALNREYIGDASSASFIEQVYKDNDIDSLLNNVDLSSELTGTALVLPSKTENPKYLSGIKLRLFDASAISVIPTDEDQSEPAAVSIIQLVDRLAKISTPQNPQIERVVRQQVWTHSTVTTYDGNLIVSTEANDLGFLPFVNFKGEEVYDQYLGHAPTTIVRKLNTHINQILTEIGFMIKMQSGTPIALEGYQSGEGIVIHPGRALSLPTGASASVLDMNPKIEDTLLVLQYLEEKIFETSSVPKITVVGGEGVSGRELLVRWFPILQVFQEKTVRFEKYELELANTILKLVGLNELEEIKVDYPEADLLPLATNEDTLLQDINLNISTPVDEMMRRNPEFSEDEAQAEVLANKETNDIILNRNEPDPKDEDKDEDKGASKDVNVNANEE